MKEKNIVTSAYGNTLLSMAFLSPSNLFSLDYICSAKAFYYSDCVLHSHKQMAVSICACALPVLSKVI